MPSPKPVTFSCEIASFEDPINGRLDDGHGRAVAFKGWIEFAAALTAMGEDAAATPTTHTEGTHHERT